MPDSLPPLTIRGLTCRRGRRLLFRDLDFAVAAGTCLWVRGPNGTGKSSLLRILAGLLPPSAGGVEIDGEPLWADRAWWGRQIHYLGHVNASKAGLTVAEQLGFFARAWRRPASAGAEALATVGLSRLAERPVRVLSAGQQRRLGLARLLLAERPIWLLDEPATALDAEGAALVDRLIQDQSARGGRVVVISHQPVAYADQTLRLGPA